MQLYPRGGNHMLAFIWIFEYQPIVSEISTKPSRYKRAESNFLANVIHLGYTSVLIHLIIFLPGIYLVLGSFLLAR